MPNRTKRKRKYGEPLMVDRYWKRTGGTLITEFPMVRRSPSCGARWADGLIILGGKPNRLEGEEKRNVDVAGKDVIVIQASNGRLGMYVMGQGVFSAELMKQFKPKSIKSVILCTEDDTALRPLLAPFHNIEVKVLADTE
jgi:hypothetical protein